ncbi:TetR/AcrR family transcriptional regulator [Fulvivirga maritima]|uniref:TetR/AcrR family transcriptional regulator n=1 Tax=Fulvivirga maritima TaxID=2904247 RepID=UPI001F3644E5|nr:TetR/AcrR family transcriptional regulator [Fulvivirga maritima]UII28364.1 TetR/AcrR family transcriptional regulator [Fulvivirga maritima]
MKEKIKNAALGLFLKYGPKRTTIDDVIWELQISKKLFYENYENKEELISEIFTEVISEAKADFCKIQDENNDSLFLLMAWQYQFYHYLKQYSEPCIYELNKYYSHLRVQYISFRQNLVFKNMMKVAQSSQQQGIIAQHVNLRIFVELQLYLLEELLFGRFRENNRLNDREQDEYVNHIITSHCKGIISKNHFDKFENCRDKVEEKYEGNKYGLSR